MLYAWIADIVWIIPIRDDASWILAVSESELESNSSPFACRSDE